MARLYPSWRACIVQHMDEGLPIAYQLLDKGVPVLSSDELQVGTVVSVLAAPEEDVFHGLLIDTPHGGVRFVASDAIAAIHEQGVDLRIAASDAAGLPGPEHAAPVYDEDPSKQQKWRHWAHRFSGRNDWHHER